jgi:hypothetical protein
MPVDTSPIRRFLDSVAGDVVEIAREDLLKLLDAADRPRAPAPRVPDVKLAA